MPVFHTSVIASVSHTENDVDNHFRLIRTMDVFQNTDVFSVFLTTCSPTGCYEAFVYDISRNPDIAASFFALICRENVTAVSLSDIAEDFIASEI